MTELLLITVAAATVNNVVLVRLLGLCPVLGHGTPVGAVRDVSLATTGVLTLTAGLSYLVDQWALVPYGLPYLRIGTDYSSSDSARIAVRLEALFETVRGACCTSA